MNGLNHKRRVFFWALALSWGILAGCASPPPERPVNVSLPPAVPATGSAGATPIDPGPPPSFGLVPVPVRTYLAEVSPYTTSGMIGLAPEMSPERLDEIMSALQGVDVPEEMVPAHETLLKGYRSIAEGRHLVVDNVRDNVLRAEGHSQMDYGQVLLQEHVQIVRAYQAALQATPLP